ncbi:hypothetical protein AB8868_00590 [Chlamydia trachomatis]|nr:hypothetical protein [Chlamydia trachomatis]
MLVVFCDQMILALLLTVRELSCMDMRSALLIDVIGKPSQN